MKAKFIVGDIDEIYIVDLPVILTLFINRILLYIILEKKYSRSIFLAYYSIAMVLKYDLEIELKSPADAVWAAIRDINFLLPKALPQTFQGIEILEGDGRSAGTVRLVIQATGPDSIESYKSKLKSVDEENKTVCYSLIEGDLLKGYKFFDDTMTVKAKGQESVLHWSCMYEKASVYAPDAEVMFRDAVIGQYQKLDAYLLNKNKN